MSHASGGNDTSMVDGQNEGYQTSENPFEAEHKVEVTADAQNIEQELEEVVTSAVLAGDEAAPPAQESKNIFLP
jgi:hypothetical protein